MPAKIVTYFHYNNKKIKILPVFCYFRSIPLISIQPILAATPYNLMFNFEQHQKTYNEFTWSILISCTDNIS